MKKTLLLGVMISMFIVTTKSYANPTQSEVREMPNVGAWKVAAFFESGVFQGCAAGLDGDGAGAGQFLTVAVSADREDWRLIIPGAGFAPGTKVELKTSISNRDKNAPVIRNSYKTTIDSDGNAVVLIHDGEISQLFNTDNDAILSGKDKEADFMAWVNNRQTSMGWTLSSRQKAADALHNCIDQNTQSSNRNSAPAVSSKISGPKEMPSVGSWKITAFFDSGVLQGCIAVLAGDGAGADQLLGIAVSANKEDWRLIVPGADLPPGTKVELKTSISDLNGNAPEIRNSHHTVIEQDGTAVIQIHDAFIERLFNTGNDAMVSSRDKEANFMAWVNNRQTSMGWTLNSRQKTWSALHNCIDKNK